MQDNNAQQYKATSNTSNGFFECVKDHRIMTGKAISLDDGFVLLMAYDHRDLTCYDVKP